MKRPYREELRRLSRIEQGTARYLVKLADGSERFMKGIEVVLYSFDVAAGIIDLGQPGYKPPIVSYELALGKDDMTAKMKEFVEESIAKP